MVRGVLVRRRVEGMDAVHRAARMVEGLKTQLGAGQVVLGAWAVAYVVLQGRDAMIGRGYF